MQLYSNLDEFERQLGNVKKWGRTLEAIQVSASVQPDVTYSVGDSLTWRKHEGIESEKYFTASRRYLRVFFCQAGELSVEYAPIENLDPVDDYSDLSDRQMMTGAGEIASLAEGNLVIFEVEEPCRVHSSSDFRGITLRVTVEGHSFHNK